MLTLMLRIHVELARWHVDFDFDFDFDFEVEREFTVVRLRVLGGGR
jgi:hypothetical protein